MLTRFIRIQLAIFTVAAVVGMAVMGYAYLQLPTLLGIGKITVTMDLPETGGLYRFGNVTYRGVQIGKVTAVDLTDSGAKATLRLDSSPKVPADLQAEVRSLSAVGEQYVELVPKTNSGPYLADGSEIRDVVIPQPVGPMLEKLNGLVKSIPKEQLSELLDETYKGLNGAGNDFESLLSSTETITGELGKVSDRTRTLFEDTGPLLDSQARTSDSIRTWSRSLAGVTEQLRENDPEIRNLLRSGPGFAQETSRLLTQLKPTLPVLLANLTSIGQVGVTYHPSLEQLLVLLPGFVAFTQGFGSLGNKTGWPVGDFSLTISDPPACTVGFIPQSEWRSPADTTVIDTPDDLYCKLPQDSPISVRGVRNLPCMGKPGKRAPSVEICNSDEPYQPLALRQHALGPTQLDPNQIMQGMPPDDRVDFSDRLYAPTEGTPLPPGAMPHGPAVAPPGPAAVPPAPDAVVPAPGVVPEAPVPAAQPSSAERGVDAPGPSVAIAHYNPKTGQYAAPDGKVYSQLDLSSDKTNRSWKDLLPQ